MVDDAKPEEGIPRAFVCTQCREPFQTKLKQCGGCKLIGYCSPECQRLDWPKHKRVCEKPLGTHAKLLKWGKQLGKAFDMWMHDSALAPGFAKRFQKWKRKSPHVRLCLEFEIPKDTVVAAKRKTLQEAIGLMVKTSTDVGFGWGNKVGKVGLQSAPDDYPFTVKLYFVDARKLKPNLDTSKFAFLLMTRQDQDFYLQYRDVAVLSQSS